MDKSYVQKAGTNGDRNEVNHSVSSSFLMCKVGSIMLLIINGFKCSWFIIGK